MSSHLLSTYYTPGTVLSMLAHCINKTTVRTIISPFIDKATEAVYPSQNSQLLSGNPIYMTPLVLFLVAIFPLTLQRRCGNSATDTSLRFHTRSTLPPARTFVNYSSFNSPQIILL